MMKFVAIFAFIAVANCGIIGHPAAYSSALISPYASTYNAHTSKYQDIKKFLAIF
jgi:hypothetical protein